LIPSGFKASDFGGYRVIHTPRPRPFPVHG
jgi:hypothetical protein